MAASSKDTNTYNRMNWENSDFPILCETCLGDNPYIRMTKEKYGKECKVCERPFTVFRWCPGAGMRFKKTEVCQTCSKIKNVCQTCLLDLEYGLPTQLRDAVLGQAEAMPTSGVNKDYYIQNKERELANTDGTTPLGALGKSSSAHQTLLKLARHKPYYKRNRAHICSFWVKGECTRGDLCPYRHEMPTDPNNPLAKQNIKDRYYGSSDPVAEKMLKRHNSRQQNQTPSDPTITTLFIGGVTEESGITEQDLRDFMYQFGEIRRVSMVTKQGAAFVEYADRFAAERAMASAANSLAMKGQNLKVMWGRGRSKAQQSERTKFAPVPGLPGALQVPGAAEAGAAADSPAAVPPGMPGTGAPSLPPGMAKPSAAASMLPPGMKAAASPSVLLPPGIRPPGGSAAAFFKPAASAGTATGKKGVHYPSMDSSRMGSRGAAPKTDAK